MFPYSLLATSKMKAISALVKSLSRHAEIRDLGLRRQDFLAGLLQDQETGILGL